MNSGKYIKNVKNPADKKVMLMLAVAFMFAITCGIPTTYVDAQLDSIPADKSGLPLSIAFHSNSVGNTEVYVMNPDGSDQTRLTIDPRVNQQPDISPDGRQIVYAGNPITETNPDGDLEIFVMNADGTDVRQLTFNVATESWPRWSPNGKQIAFHSNVDGNFEIYLIGADGSDLTRVTDYPGLEQFPEWSPNGKQLVIRRDTDLYLIGSDGSDPIRLTNDAALDQMGSFSPSGKRIAYMSASLGYCAVFVMNSDGTDATNLTPKPDAVPASQFCSRAPAWSRDGQQIYFSSFRPETNLFENIFVMDADGSNVTRLTFDNSTVSVAAVR